MLAVDRVQVAVLVYLGTRALLIVVALIDAAVRHRSLVTGNPSELANWDGRWYSKLATGGYPTYASHLHTTLGFFPLYPSVVGALARVFSRLGVPLPFAQLVYLAGVLACVHFLWRFKTALFEPLLWSGVVALLLGIRIVSRLRISRPFLPSTITSAARARVL